MGLIVQKINIVSRDRMDKAKVYYACISSLNGLGMTEREIQLMAYMAVNGSVSNIGTRNGFCKEYDTTPAVVTNLVSSLKKKRMVIKRNKKVMIAPPIALDFSKNVKLEVTIGAEG